MLLSTLSLTGFTSEDFTMSLKPLKTAKGYYDRVWKVVIKAQRPHWKGGKFAQCNHAVLQLTERRSHDHEKPGLAMG